MSIIQNIRDRAWIIAAAIAIALIAFIVQDAFQGGGGMGLFGGASTTIGKVDGKKIEYADFETRYKQIEDNYLAQNYPVDDQLRSQIREQLWNQYVEEAVLSDDYEKLGLAVTTNERGDLLYGSNPPPQLAQQFRDSLGNYSPSDAFAAVNSLKKNTPAYEQFWGQFVPELEKSRLREKFTTLISKSAYVPKWLVEKTNTESSQRSSISYVQIPYSTIPDSTIKVTDEEIQKYVSEHSKIYTQEKARGISYVSFDAGPTKKDSTEVYDRVLGLKDQFAQATDPQSFVVTNNSETPYFDGFVLSSKMQMEQKDTLRQLPVGQVYGPYIDGDKYVLAKKIDSRTMPDTAVSRHILIKIYENQQGQLVPIRSDSAAKKLIDSVVTALRAGTPFDTLVAKVSEDQGSIATGGKYDFTSTQFQTISKEFAETIFYGKPGDKKTVKVENQQYSGYHYIEVLEHKNVETAYKIAYFSRPIVASDQTINAANGLASQFTAESRDLKSFEANAKKKNLNVFSATDIKPLESMIPSIGNSREMVRWIFKADRGDVSETPFSLGDKFIVPVVTQIYDKGPMSADKARPMVEYRIRNDKKAEQITKMIGNANTLEAIAQAVKQPVLRVDSIQFNSPFIPNVGAEQKLLGAAFNPAFKDKVSGPIKGELGVFVIKVENIVAVPNPNFDAAAQKQAMQQQQEGMAFRALEALKKAANVKDYREKFY
jgi:peptidyl-prolyl cis-trans isomerase D